MREEVPVPGHFTIVTLGCKVNHYESEALACRLLEDGWVPGDDPDGALCIINTCTVTGRAAMQSRQAVRRAARQGARCIVVTGCYAQVNPEVLAAIDGVDLVVGHSQKQCIADLVRNADAIAPGALAPIVVSPRSAAWSFEALHDGIVAGRTRPLLKIQDGCDAFCTYCIVPHARGRSRSMAADEVLRCISALAAAGYTEAVLTGIHLGRYGRDLDPPVSLGHLLARIDAQSGIERFRVSSIEPQEFDAPLIAALSASPRCCRHFHIPLQSGDDDILRRMARPYTAGAVADLVLTLTRAVPEAAVGLDVLVGFPGESEKAFENTCHLIESLPLAYLHVFPFSPRAGTPAARMSEAVPSGVITRRCNRLRRLGQRKRHLFCRRFIGREFCGPVEARRDPLSGRLRIVTDNYLPVEFEGPDRLFSTRATLRIDALDPTGRITGHRLD